MAVIWRPDGQRTVHSTSEVQEALADPDCRVWVDVEEADEGTVTALASIFGLHDLLEEDILRRDRRAKIVPWDDTLHLVVPAVRFDGDLLTTEVDIVLGRRFLVSIHRAQWRPAEAMSASSRSPGSLLAEGVDMVLHAVLDPIVDSYFPVIDRISDEIDDLEDGVVSNQDAQLLERLVRVRRWLLEIRHIVGPVREILDQLSERDFPAVTPEHRPYFRDGWGQTVHLIEELDTQRELATAVLEAYLSGVNNNLAEVMKRLTAITAVLAGIGASAGIFGMSEAATAFGLPTPFGFWLVTAITVVVGLFVLAYFRHIDWI